ncbi:hypothetical protein EC973_007546 [Apophysomyces ossiformis]|uniref:Methyltransferase domain-containing protein n=1 Tax=Apophysomyces ossiformis TaxID=679940 RepID=A0A8H7BM10_9FUNG|nr:hypothetical protein EC973_007546 [Apophysomyces ossiformis]
MSEIPQTATTDPTYVQDTEGPVLAGRKYHNVATSSYWLPKDEEEQMRLTGAHFATKELFGGNYLSKAKDHVPFEEGAQVLDIGCGSGTWIMDMATAYPNSTFTGIDIANVFPEKGGELPNVTFQIANVLEGLPFEDESFHFVHLRVLVAAVRKEEWPFVIKEAARLVKPGGCVHFNEFEPRESGSEECRRVLRAVETVMEQRGQEPFIGTKLASMVGDAGLEVIQKDGRAVDLANEDSVSKTWRWIWAKSCSSMMPMLGPLLKVDEKAHNSFVMSHIEDMVHSHGRVHIKVTLTRKPTEAEKQ